MQRILFLLQRYYHLVLFIILQIVSLYSIFRFNAYQEAVLFTSANEITGRLESRRSSIKAYFALKEENKELRNSIFLKLNDSLNSSVMLFSGDTFIHQNTDIRQYFSYIPALVIGNSVHISKNYLTLNRGASHGVQKGMGVIGEKGIVGKVIAVSSNFALVMSALNSDFSLSPRHAGSENLGEFSWKEGDPQYAQITKFSKYNPLKKGDFFVTSGYSSLFPENIPVGQVISLKKSEESDYYDLKIKLSSNFQSIRTAYVVKNNFRTEIDSLQFQIPNP